MKFKKLQATVDSHSDLCDLIEPVNVYQITTGKRLVQCSCGWYFWLSPVDIKALGWDD